MTRAMGAGSALAMSSPGVTYPDEAAPHTRTFMQWPVNRKVHPDSVFLEMLQRSIADIANTIAEFEPVVMLMDRVHTKAARRILGRNVEIWDVSTDDLWCRDSGPVFVVGPGGRLAVCQLNFNGWGGKQTHRHDGQVARRVAERLELPMIDSGVVGEAGGLESDGAGTVMAHASSWVNPNRNALPKAAIEARLLKAFGARKMIWAPGLAGYDITDYHIDSLCRFTAPGRVLIQLPDPSEKGEPFADAAYATHDILSSATDARNQPLAIELLRDPRRPRVKARDFVASYVNYYVCNGAVISAQFGDAEADEAARHMLARLYRDREIIALNVDPIGEIGGGIHCATQQQPAI